MEATTCKKELVIEIPVDVVEREADSVAAQFAKRVRIPGFRPGHAPASLVRQHFRDDIRSEVVQTLLPRFFETAVKEQKWEIVSQPRFEDLKFEDAQPLTCKATFEIYPEFELQPYKELEVEEELATVTDADVEEAVQELRDRAATFELVSDRPAADDDHVTINYQGRDTESPPRQPVEVQEAVVHLGGKHTVGAFTENLRGVKAGDVREFAGNLPAGLPPEIPSGQNPYVTKWRSKASKRKWFPRRTTNLPSRSASFRRWRSYARSCVRT